MKAKDIIQVKERYENLKKIIVGVRKIKNDFISAFDESRDLYNIDYETSCTIKEIELKLDRDIYRLKKQCDELTVEDN